MQDDIVALFEYDRWANRKLLDACRKLTAEQYVAEPVPGWSSVRSTVVHIAIVTEGWIRGLTGETVGHAPDESDFPTVDDAERLLDRGYRILDGLFATLTPQWLATPMTLRGGGRTAVLPP